MHVCRFCNTELSQNNWYPSSKKAKNYCCISCHTAYYRSKYDPQKNKIKSKKYEEKLKLGTINAYGGQCVCCGENDINYLSLDHIYNDGFKDRKKKLSGGKIYRYLKLNDYPQGRFQVLCYNCNSVKGYYKMCPHKINYSENYCYICCDDLIEREVDERNYLENFHPFFKKSKINICLDCSMKVKNINNKNSKVTKLNMRYKVLEKYGGKCKHCEESRYCFLTIDHINGRGKNDNFDGYKLCQWLTRNGYPTDNYQLLCWNCNCAKGFLTRGIRDYN